MAFLKNTYDNAVEFNAPFNSTRLSTVDKASNLFGAVFNFQIPLSKPTSLPRRSAIATSYPSVVFNPVLR